MKLTRYLSFARARAAEGHTPFYKQLFDMVLLFTFKRIGPGHYLQGKLWQRDKTWQDKAAQINEADYLRRVARLNLPRYQKISQHKVVEKSLLSLFNIPAARFYGYFHTDSGTTFQGLPLRTAAELEQLIRSERLKKFCCKQVEGFGGYGFRALECVFDEQDHLHLQPLDGGEPTTANEFVAELDSESEQNNGYIIEQYLEQHVWYQNLNPSSLNTIRVHTLWKPKQRPKVTGALLRIGRQGKLVDNSSSGGIFASVDIGTGKLSSAQSFDLFDTSEFTHHPDSKAPLKDEILPLWQDIKNLTERTLPLFPNTRFIGFDIAVTPEGPVVIETNVEPEKMHFVQTGLPIKKLLSE